MRKKKGSILLVILLLCGCQSQDEQRDMVIPAEQLLKTDGR